MGKYRSGLRAWWEGVIDFAHDKATAGWKGTIKPSLLRLIEEFRSFMRRERTERESELFLGLACWGIIATAIAAKFGLLFEFLLGMAAGVSLMSGWASCMRRRAQRRSVITAGMELFRESMVSSTGGGFERVDWINKILQQAWPYFTLSTEQERPRIRDFIEPILEQYRSAMYRVIRENHDEQHVQRYTPVEEIITSLYVNNISLGEAPPVIEGLKLYDLKNGKVIVTLAASWTSDPQVTLGVGTSSGVIPIMLENLKISGKIRLILRITDSPPFVAAVVATLPTEPKPEIDFKLRPLESSVVSNFFALPKLTKQLRTFISNAINDTLLWPHRLVVPCLPPKDIDLSPLYLRLQGRLTVGLIKGTNLINLYPYVTVYCRPKVKLRTKSIGNTRDPVWNEEFILDVEDQDSQSLVLQVMNESKGPDEFVGIAVYPLKGLALDRDVELELDVQPRKKKRWSRRDVEADEGDGEGEASEKAEPQRRSYGKLTVELRYHVYWDPEREAAMEEEEKLEKALATPTESGSYSTALELIHDY